MAEEFTCIYESFENNSIFLNFENDIQYANKFFNGLSCLSELIISKEKEITTSIQNMVLDIKAYMIKVKYLDANVNELFKCMLNNFENIYSFRIQKMNEKINALDELNKSLTIINEVSIKKSIYEKSKIEAIQASVYYNFTMPSKSSTSINDIADTVKNYKLKKSSYFNFLKDTSIYWQMVNSSSIISLFEVFLIKETQLIYHDFTQNALNLNDKYKKNIIDFCHNQDRILPQEVLSKFSYNFKEDYNAEGFLLKKNFLGSHTLIYAAFDKSNMQFDAKECDVSSNIHMIIDVFKLEGENDDKKKCDLILTSKKQKRYIFNALSKENLFIWLKKFDGSMKNEKPTNYANIGIIKQKIQNKDIYKINIDIIMILVSIIESGSPNVYLSMKQIDNNYKFPIDINCYDDVNIFKKNSTEACYDLKYYIENSSTLIEDEIYEKYTSVDNHDITFLRYLVKLIPSQNLNILSVLFYHFSKMIDINITSHIPLNSLALIFGHLMNKKVIINKDKQKTIIQQCQLFTDFLINTKDLFAVYNKTDEIEIKPNAKKNIITDIRFNKNTPSSQKITNANDIHRNDDRFNDKKIKNLSNIDLSIKLNIQNKPFVPIRRLKQSFKNPEENAPIEKPSSFIKKSIKKNKSRPASTDISSNKTDISKSKFYVSDNKYDDIPYINNNENNIENSKFLDEDFNQINQKINGDVKISMYDENNDCIIKDKKENILKNSFEKYDEIHENHFAEIIYSDKEDMFETNTHSAKNNNKSCENMQENLEKCHQYKFADSLLIQDLTKTITKDGKECVEKSLKSIPKPCNIKQKNMPESANYEDENDINTNKRSTKNVNCEEIINSSLKYKNSNLIDKNNIYDVFDENQLNNLINDSHRRCLHKTTTPPIPPRKRTKMIPLNQQNLSHNNLDKTYIKVIQNIESRTKLTKDNNLQKANQASTFNNDSRAIDDNIESIGKEESKLIGKILISNINTSDNHNNLISKVEQDENNIEYINSIDNYWSPNVSRCNDQFIHNKDYQEIYTNNKSLLLSNVCIKNTNLSNLNYSKLDNRVKKINDLNLKTEETDSKMNFLNENEKSYCKPSKSIRKALPEKP